MRRLKLALRIGGVSLAACGLLFIGSASWTQPGQESAFDDFARAGAFAPVGRITLIVGAMAFLLSFVVPGRIDDDVETRRRPM